MNLGVAQLVARYLGVVEAASSSLVTQTKVEHSSECSTFFILQGFSAFLGMIWPLPKSAFFSSKIDEFRRGTTFGTTPLQRS